MTVANPDIPIMQIDGRVAMAGNEPDLLAHRQRLGIARQLESTGLVGHAGDPASGPAVHPWRAALRAVGLEPGIHDGAVGGGNADYAGEHEQAVLEFAVAAALARGDACI